MADTLHRSDDAGRSGVGSLGNFINHELTVRISDLPWAVAFPSTGPEPRSPSALYELALEGVVLSVLM